MNLIENWRAGWKMFSMQALVIIGVLQGVLLVLPPDALMARAPFTGGASWHDVAVWLTVAAALLGGIGRLLQQNSVTPSATPAP